VHDLGTFTDLGSAFQATAEHVLDAGEDNAGRERSNREAQVIVYRITSPRARIIDLPERRPNVAFLLAECLWQLACRSDVTMLQHYAPTIGRFSADGVEFTGSAYGARLFSVRPALGASQWDHVLSCLREDCASRRAILTLVDPDEIRLNRNRDVTCTTGLQFLIRGDALHMVASMRSNDVMRGMQSDVFFFTLLHEIAAIQLGLPLGSYTHVTTLAQIYEPDVAWAQACVRGSLVSSGTMLALPEGDIWAALSDLIAGEALARAGKPPGSAPGSLERWLEILATHPANVDRERNYDCLLSDPGADRDI
jgi:thymidylate synthase